MVSLPSQPAYWAWRWCGHLWGSAQTGGWRQQAVGISLSSPSLEEDAGHSWNAHYMDPGAAISVPDFV